MGQEYEVKCSCEIEAYCKYFTEAGHEPKYSSEAKDKTKLGTVIHLKTGKKALTETVVKKKMKLITQKSTDKE